MKGSAVAGHGGAEVAVELIKKRRSVMGEKGVPMFESAGKSKVDWYKWAKPGDNGRYRRVPIDELLIDYAYQRKEVSQYNTTAIARNFNWNAFGTLIVMERANGKLYVVDGQQRLLAARQRADITLIPCLIFHSDGSQHEARAFKQSNTQRTHVPAVETFKAAVVGGEPPYAEIGKWMRGSGYIVAADNQNSKCIMFPALLVKTWGIDKTGDICRKAIEAQEQFSAGNCLQAMPHKGICYLMNRGKYDESFTPLLLQAGGAKAIEGEARDILMATNKHGIGPRQSAQAILNIVNKRRRTNKIKLDEE